MNTVSSKIACGVLTGVLEYRNGDESLVQSNIHQHGGWLKDFATGARISGCPPVRLEMKARGREKDRQSQRHQHSLRVGSYSAGDWMEQWGMVQ